VSPCQDQLAQPLDVESTCMQLLAFAAQQRSNQGLVSLAKSVVFYLLSPGWTATCQEYLFRLRGFDPSSSMAAPEEGYTIFVSKRLQWRR
jgi:hypothetical protein